MTLKVQKGSILIKKPGLTGLLITELKMKKQPTNQKNYSSC